MPKPKKESKKLGSGNGAAPAPEHKTGWVRRYLLGGIIWFVLAIVGGVIGSITGLWVPFWPTDPEIHPRDTIDGSKYVFPFSVKNTNARWIPMDPAKLICGIDKVYAEDAIGRALMITRFAVVTGAHKIEPGETISYPCDASELFGVKPDGTLSFAGADALATTQDKKPIYFTPPFRVVKMCVWVGLEYQAFWHTWTFKSKIDQWPATPSLHQWVEGPIVYNGPDDPFSDLRAPDYAFGMQSPTYPEGGLRPYAYRCSDSLSGPYGLADGSGSVKFIPNIEALKLRP